MVRLLGSLILMLSGEVDAETCIENLWQKGTTEYWNGYTGQKCLVMDDCFQVKGKPGDMDSEAMQLIRAIGNWSYPLNFADLESKGKIYLDSPLVIGTTNCDNVVANWSEFITCPEALVRRFQTAAWIEVAPAYQVEGSDTPKFDWVKFEAAMEEAAVKLTEQVRVTTEAGIAMTADACLDCLPLDAWEFHMHDFKSTFRKGNESRKIEGGLRSIIVGAARAIIDRRKSNAEGVSNLKTIAGAMRGITIQTGGRTNEIEPAAIEEAAESSFEFPKLEPVWTDFESSASSVPSEKGKVDPMGFMTAKEYEMHVVASKERGARFAWFSKFAGFVTGWCDGIRRRFPVAHHILVPLAQAGTIALTGAAILLIVKLVHFLYRLVMGMVTSVVELVKALFSKEEPEAQSNERPLPVMKSQKSKNMEFASRNFVGDIKAQAGFAPNEAVHDHLYHGTYKCTLSDGPEAADDTEVGQFIGLGSDVFLFPRHYAVFLSDMCPKRILTFRSTRTGEKSTISVGDFLKLRIIQVEKYDVAAVAFGVGFLKATRNIVKYFLTEREIKLVLRGSNACVRLDLAKVDKKGRVSRTIYTSDYCEYVDQEGQFAGVLRYKAPTVKGDCGAPLSLVDGRHFGSRCMMGMHVAGRENTLVRYGYSVVVTQELARDLFNELASYKEKVDPASAKELKPATAEETIQAQSMLQEIGIVGGSMDYLGELNEPINISTTTQLKMSDFGRAEVLGPCTKAPAKLRGGYVDYPGHPEHGVKKEPMSEGLKAYQSMLIAKTGSDLKPIVSLAMEQFWNETIHHPRTILSFEEAVQPPETLKLKPINRQTSPGYKYREFVTPRTPGKTAFFGFEGDYIDPTNLTQLKLQQDVLDIIEDAKSGVRGFHLCTDFLKDELRPLEKVKLYKTRVISGTPLDYSLAVKMYFGAFQAAMFATHIKNGMAPGTNHYTEWADLAEFVLAPGKEVFDGDFSRFDASEQPWVHDAILDYINEWYRFGNASWSPVDDQVRRVLWMDLVHSRHITGAGCTLNYVTQWNKSLPSGHPLTTLVNSMYSLITATACYVKRTGDLVDMWKHVRINTFGDDILVGTDEETVKVFNQITMAEDMKELFNLEFTPGAKDGVWCVSKKLDESTFLKRDFHQDETIQTDILPNRNLGWVGRLAWESWATEPYFYKSARDPMGDLTTRIEHCLLEMSLWPVATWEENFPKIQLWCKENGVTVPLTTREGARHKLQSRFDIWY